METCVNGDLCVWRLVCMETCVYGDLCVRRLVCMETCVNDCKF